MSLYEDYPITLRGRNGVAHAFVRGGKVSIASLWFDGDVDVRGKPAAQTHHGELDAGGNSTALGALDEAERESLFAQVRNARG